MDLNTILYSAAIILVIAGVTVFTRFGPFLLFGRSERIPTPVVYLGAVMPAAVIVMLIVYCLRGLDFTQASQALPALIACAVTAAAHWFGRNTLLSIGGGTILYMALVQAVF